MYFCSGNTIRTPSIHQRMHSSVDIESSLQSAAEESARGNFSEAEMFAGNVISAVREATQTIPPSREQLIGVAKARLILSGIASRRGNFESAIALALELIDDLTAQRGSKDDDQQTIHDLHTKALNSIGIMQWNLGSYDKALEYFGKALAAHEKFNEHSAIARMMGNIGNVYYYLGEFDKALEYFGKALETHLRLDEKSMVADITGNIGNVYYVLNSHSLALDYYRQALTANEALGDASSVALVEGNIGIVYNSLGEYDKALECYERALKTHQALGEHSSIALVTGNIGIVYSSLGRYDTALDYYTQALTMHEQLGEKSEIAIVTGNIGSLYATPDYDGYNPLVAHEYLQKAIELCLTIGAKGLLVDLYKSQAELYEHEGQWKHAFISYKKYRELESEVQSEDAKQKALKLEQQKQTAEREKEIELAKAAAAAELLATTALLHKVLPESIATRIIAGEERIADYYSNVSVLFADMVGFTALATQVVPDIVVELLNHVFDVFDEIMKRHGCEKVKTMGDGYMAVAGAPEKCDDHAERIARAALEMLHEIQIPDDVQEYLPPDMIFKIRVGIHTGSAICGVMGRERFVWDVYSDAVNTASRMESTGEAGKIHVSQDFVSLLQHRSQLTGQHEFHFTERGEVEIKGKGIMKTYFLSPV